MTNSNGSVVYDPTASFPVTETEAVYRRDGDGAWKVRVHQPEGDGPFPALLAVHGGAWTIDGWPRLAPVERALAASGIVVASIQLRRAPRHVYPASVADVNHGTRWLKAHAAEFNADPARVGAIGSSSGGHLVVLSALRPDDPRYAALPLSEAPEADATLAYLVAMWPPIDPLARYQNARRTSQDGLVEASLGYFGDEDGMREGSPQHLLDAGQRPALPPLLIVHGAVDTAVPPAIPERFAASYRAAGGDATFELFPNMPHSFIGPDHATESARALALIKAFIARWSLAPKAVEA